MPPASGSAGAPTHSYVALLRGINVGGRNALPMAELRALCVELGFERPRSYIQSGNLLFGAGDEPASVEDTLERAIEMRFGLSVPVVVRTADAWSAYVAGNPFPEASRSDPRRVMIALAKAPPAEDAAEVLQARAADGERLRRVGDALWIHYAAGAGRSKLSPGLLDRTVGSPVTTRNWRTVLKLDQMAAAAPGMQRTR